MRLHRFYTKSILMIGEASVETTDTALIHQLAHVFRYKPGQRVLFFDGTGLDYEYEIVSLKKSGATFSLQATHTNMVTTKPITIAFALLKKANNELIVQKCTELGVSAFQPLMTDRAEKKSFDSIRAHKIALEATEQSGRDEVPTISTVAPLADYIDTNAGSIIVFHMDGQPLSSVIRDVLRDKPLTILIGPEGGWSDDELALFKSKNIPLYTLGNTVLRAETAAIAAVAIL